MGEEGGVGGERDIGGRYMKRERGGELGPKRERWGQRDLGKTVRHGGKKYTCY